MNKPDYGNWVPKSMFKAMAAMQWVMTAICFSSGRRGHRILSALVCIVQLVCAGFTAYMWKCRNIFSFEKGGLMGEIHAYLLQHLLWDGKGKVLDIGCGAGALSIRCAQMFPEAEITGVDYWGKEWNYAKEQCESNAEFEGVAERMHFEKGDAAALPYEDETFDAAISNFVFHEVHTQPDKREVVREALRVVKKGGVFAFQDLFGQEKLYGNIDELIDQLRQEGISEIHYIADVDKLPFIPRFTRAPWMLYKMGLLYGVK